MRTVLLFFLIAPLIFSCDREKKNNANPSNEPISMQQTADETFVPKPFDTSLFSDKIEALISEMTLEEKVGMLHGQTMFATAGVERLGIPPLRMADGPLGVREEISLDSWAPAGWDNDFATYYPAGGGVATQITTDPARDLYPDWSPNGKQIVFQSERGGAGWDIWIVATTPIAIDGRSWSSIKSRYKE